MFNNMYLIFIPQFCDVLFHHIENKFYTNDYDKRESSS